MGNVRDATRTALQALVDEPGEELVTVWYPPDGDIDFCVSAKRMDDGPPEVVYFQPSPMERVVWLEEEERSRMWDEVLDGG